MTALPAPAKLEHCGSLPDDMEQDLAHLEAKLATLIAHTRALRAANESLRADLAAAMERNREMTIKVQQAGARLDALIARMPAE